MTTQAARLEAAASAARDELDLFRSARDAEIAAVKRSWEDRINAAHKIVAKAEADAMRAKIAAIPDHSLEGRKVSKMGYRRGETVKTKIVGTVRTWKGQFEVDCAKYGSCLGAIVIVVDGKNGRPTKSGERVFASNEQAHSGIRGTTFQGWTLED